MSPHEKFMSLIVTPLDGISLILLIITGGIITMLFNYKILSSQNCEVGANVFIFLIGCIFWPVAVGGYLIYKTFYYIDKLINFDNKIKQLSDFFES